MKFFHKFFNPRNLCSSFSSKEGEPVSEAAARRLLYMRNFKISAFALLFAGVFLAGCGSSRHVAVYDGGRMPEPDKRINNVDIEIWVDKKKLRGSATCTKFLFLTLEAPAAIAYGYTLQTSSGVRGGDCVGGAIYDAVDTKTGYKADFLIGAKYDVNSVEVLCIFSACLYSSHKVEVSGYPGYVKDIKSSTGAGGVVDDAGDDDEE
jgi:hypothetical protein